MELNTLQGAILDLDGTLLDSMNVWSDIDKELAEMYHIGSHEQITEAAKQMTIQESSEYLVRTYSLPVTPQELKQQIEAMAANQYRNLLPLKDGAADFLTGLDKMGIKYGIATATYPQLARAALDRLGLTSRVQFILTESEFGSGKSEPHIYYEGARLLGLGKRQVIVAEDTLHSILTAKKAGFFTAGVFDAATPPDDWKQICANATISVKKLPDILKLI